MSDAKERMRDTEDAFAVSLGLLINEVAHVSADASSSEAALHHPQVDRLLDDLKLALELRQKAWMEAGTRSAVIILLEAKAKGKRIDIDRLVGQVLQRKDLIS